MFKNKNSIFIQSVKNNLAIFPENTCFRTLYGFFIMSADGRNLTNEMRIG